MNIYLGIDIGGTFIKYGIVTEKGDILFKDNCPTDRLHAEVVLDKLVSIILEQKEKYPIEKVGISLPGVIDKHNKLLTSGAIDNMYTYDVARIIHERTELDIHLTNDANAVAYAEKWLGAGRECHNFVCLPLGTGVGGAIVIDGKVVKGRTGLAGEFGISLLGLAQKDPVGYDSATFYCGAIAGLCRIYNLKLGIADYAKWERDIQVILERADKGQVEAIDSLDEFYNNVAVLLLNVSVTIDPEQILIGGGISENDYIMQGIKLAFYKLLARYDVMSSLGYPEVNSCQLGNTAGIVGAVAACIL